MTLILGIARPEDGIWLCGDRRITNKQTGDALPDQDKLIYVSCPNGTLLLGGAGLARIARDHAPFMDWIRETLRGETRSVQDSAHFLKDRLSRDVFRHWRTPLIIGGFAIVGTRADPQGPLADGQISLVAITNTVQSHKGGDAVLPRFHLSADQLSVPRVIAFGSGEKHISSSDRQLLLRAAANRPDMPQNYMSLLAAVMRRTAPSVPGGEVSLWSDAWHVPITSIEAKWGNYFRDGTDSHGSSSAPSLFFGIDLTEMTTQGHERLQAMNRGEDLDQNDWASRIHETAVRSVIPRP
jgi:hypothetical protein